MTGASSPIFDMGSLLYSINVTVPVFAMMILGYALRRTRVINEEYITGSNRLTFRVLLPVMLFNSMRGSDFRSTFSPGFLLFCFSFLLLYPLTVWLIASCFIRDRKKLGSFVQGAFRGNTAVIGVSVAQNIYGADLGPMPFMLAAAMFMYNTVSVLILTCSGSADTTPREQVVRVCREIATNRIIWGILLGVGCSLAQVRFPAAIDKIFTNIGGIASAVSLIAAGGGFSVESFRTDAKLIAAAAAAKLLVMPAAALALGYFLGYRGVTLFSVLIMSGVSTATTSAVMARELQCDEDLAINILAATTLCVAVSLTMWVSILYTLHLL